ncbi:MAG: cation:proton antiporter [candidate division KSB1 bacterium]|nr:cation:proton antiporter [candidate division KSB1 bacterium]MDZ7365693.1 cation:proton antiporter [candidate division KSB1 bacterium]MDZ7403231.1 cation:proton antiporter [candidate division KSB1 bacterium]
MSANLITIAEHELTRFFFAITLLLVFAHSLGYVFNKVKMPKVIGEICGGLLLGPTVLGALFPKSYDWLFSAFEFEGKLLSLVYWLGLVLLMFVSGFEIKMSLDQDDKKIILALLIGSTVPFFAGWIAPYFFDFTPLLGAKQNMLALKIVIGIAVAVTSIPVISKIFLDLKVMHTRFARIILTTATIHDVLLWVALAIATSLVSASSYSVTHIVSTVVLSFAFLGVSLVVMPKILPILTGNRYNLVRKSSSAGYILFLCFLFSAVASLLNVNIIFGAFMAGVAIGVLPASFNKEKEHVKEIALAFFTPLYFAIVGLKLDLLRQLDLELFLFFLLFSMIFETIGTLTAAKLLKTDWLTSFNFAVAMNTRGGPGIVLATIAYDLGIISAKFFVALVLIAIFTSLLAGTWFKFILSRGGELLKETAGRFEVREKSFQI